jgi:hypothetical protein
MFRVRYNVLTEMTAEIPVFWNVPPCSLVEAYQRFTETSVNVY